MISLSRFLKPLSPDITLTFQNSKRQVQYGKSKFEEIVEFL